jgi:hypothetical protein
MVDAFATAMGHLFGQPSNSWVNTLHFGRTLADFDSDSDLTITWLVHYPDLVKDEPKVAFDLEDPTPAEDAEEKSEIGTAR